MTNLHVSNNMLPTSTDCEPITATKVSKQVLQALFPIHHSECGERSSTSPETPSQAYRAAAGLLVQPTFEANCSSDPARPPLQEAGVFHTFGLPPGYGSQENIAFAMSLAEDHCDNPVELPDSPAFVDKNLLLIHLRCRSNLILRSANASLPFTSDEYKEWRRIVKGFWTVLVRFNGTVTAPAQALAEQ